MDLSNKFEIMFHTLQNYQTESIRTSFKYEVHDRLIGDIFE